MWKRPIKYDLIPSAESESFKTMKTGETALPLTPHPGAFAAVRKNHIHEGVDLYCPEGTPVYAVESGKVTNVIPFTGKNANSKWWNDTEAILIEGKTGVVVYGEVTTSVSIGDHVAAGDLVGYVKQVLLKDKGRPMSMLHLELHDHGALDAPEWIEKRPATLRDPTNYLRDSKL